MDYTIINSKEALEYLEKNNKPLTEYSSLSIPSEYGMIYELSNGEIVLMEPSNGDDYPAFIFHNYESFKKCCDADYFPIGAEHMTWLESRTDAIQGFLKDDNFYQQPLQEFLGLSPFKDYKDCEVGYEKLLAYVKSKKNTGKEKMHLAHCYAFAITKFLIEHKNYEWKLRKSYEVYNPYYEPVVIKEGTDLEVNVITKLHIAVEGYEKSNFRTFLFFITRIPMNAELD